MVTSIIHNSPTQLYQRRTYWWKSSSVSRFLRNLSFDGGSLLLFLRKLSAVIGQSTYAANLVQLGYHAVPYLTMSYLNTSPYQMEPIYLQRMHLRCTPPVAIKNQINEFHRNFKSSKMFDQFRRLLLETIEPIDWTTVNGPRYRQQDVKTLIRVIFHAWQHRNSGMKSGDFSSGCLKRSLREFKVVLMPVQPKGLPWVVDSLLSSSFSSLSLQKAWITIESTMSRSHPTPPTQRWYGWDVSSDLDSIFSLVLDRLGEPGPGPGLHIQSR